MNGNLDERIRGLAQPLWESAARPYGMAIDFWLMAEQMVMEVVTTTARLQSKVAARSAPPDGELPEGMPVARVRELAECMWEAAGRQYGMAQDFWLAAERHVLAMLRASAFPTNSEKPGWAAELATLSPAAYLEQIRRMAYYSWEAAGRSYGNTLDCWLQAERDLLAMMSAATEGGDRTSPPADGISPAGAPKGAAAVDVPAHPAAGAAAADDPAGGEAVAAPPPSAGRSKAAAKASAGKPRRKLTAA